MAVYDSIDMEKVLPEEWDALFRITKKITDVKHELVMEHMFSEQDIYIAFDHVDLALHQAGWKERKS